MGFEEFEARVKKARIETVGRKERKRRTTRIVYPAGFVLTVWVEVGC